MEEIVKELNFGESGLIPVIAQDYVSDEVLMLAYMNREAFDKTLETGKVHYWSRSRQKLWLKGETSGHFQIVKSMKLDCDGDALLIKVEQISAACHTGHYSCFYRELENDGIKEMKYRVFEPEKAEADGTTSTDKEIAGAGCGKSAILQELYEVIVDRRQNPKEGSYTNYLFDKGLDKILKKVGEETAEVIIAAKNKSKDELRYEAADLVYHLFVLMAERGLRPDDIYDELKKRHVKG